MKIILFWRHKIEWIQQHSEYSLLRNGADGNQMVCGLCWLIVKQRIRMLKSINRMHNILICWSNDLNSESALITICFAMIFCLVRVDSFRCAMGVLMKQLWILLFWTRAKIGREIKIKAKMKITLHMIAPCNHANPMLIRFIALYGFCAHHKTGKFSEFRKHVRTKRFVFFFASHRFFVAFFYLTKTGT